jgi:hypothetical protein
MTDALVEFLRARFDEDEQHARKDLQYADKATPGWGAHYGHNLPYSELRAGSELIARVESERHADDLAMMGRFKPEVVRCRAERVLAEVDAKRRLVAESRIDDHNFGSVGPWTLRVLALPYADHPDYRPEWRPDGEPLAE